MKDWRRPPVLGIRPALDFGQPGPPPLPLRNRPRKELGRPTAESAGSQALMDRCFRELVRYYRHSGSGRLCRGLVHRMNSSLQVLFFHLDMLERKSREDLKILPQDHLPGADQLQSSHGYRLQKIQQFRLELENIRSLTRAILLHGSHEEVEEPQHLDLNELFHRELDLYKSHSFFKTEVEKNFSFQEDLPRIYGYYIDFSQSFRILLENALDAMQEATQRRLTVTTAWEDGCRLLHLDDTGVGIPAEIKPRLFEPFFTTKGTGRWERAGLGLFMARRLLAPYRGEIRVQSAPGATRVTVVLPVL